MWGYVYVAYPAERIHLIHLIYSCFLFVFVCVFSVCCSQFSFPSSSSSPISPSLLFVLLHSIFPSLVVSLLAIVTAPPSSQSWMLLLLSSLLIKNVKFFNVHCACCNVISMLQLKKMCNKQQPKNEVMRIETVRDFVKTFRIYRIQTHYKQQTPSNENGIRTCIIYYNASVDTPILTNSA